MFRVDRDLCFPANTLVHGCPLVTQHIQLRCAVSPAVHIFNTEIGLMILMFNTEAVQFDWAGLSSFQDDFFLNDVNFWIENFAMELNHCN